ncbi:PilN domain-containing protein [Desulfococcus sp.]|uniref:PilN domain-containing protein n=1 Tax=Desulfococcus sp. TaxID=2025834 RepID=UPI0035932810
MLDGKIEALDGQIDYTQKEIAKYKKIAMESEALKQKIAVLKTKLKIIDNLEKSQKTAFHLMDTMTAMVIEKKMWFSRLEAMEKAAAPPAAKPQKARGSKKKGEKERKAQPIGEPKRPEIDVEIDGIALDNQTVADFMTRLEENDLFANIRLINLKLETMKQGKGQEDINLRNFQVHCKGIPEKSEAKKNPS